MRLKSRRTLLVWGRRRKEEETVVDERSIPIDNRIYGGKLAEGRKDGRWW